MRKPKLLLFIGLLISISLLSFSIGYVFIDNSSNFSQGVFNNTEINGTFIQLTQNVSIKELPNYQTVENFYGGVNMSGNVLLLHFDNKSQYGESLTNAYDFSGNGNNMSCNSSGPSVTVSGMLSMARQFDSTQSQYFFTNNTMTPPSSSFTYLFWIKTPSVSEGVMYFSNGIAGNSVYDRQVCVNSIGDIGLRVYGSSLGGNGQGWTFSSTNISDNQWHLIAAVNDVNSGKKIYVDGVLDSSDSTPYPGYNGYTNPYFQVGLSVNDNASAAMKYFNGSLDEVSVFNRTLSASEIYNIYNRQKGNYINAGQFMSKVFDAGSIAAWQNMSFSTELPYRQELPNYQSTETYSNGINMSGNVLLLHFNNDSRYGENATNAYDFSGNGDNASCLASSCPVSVSSGEFGRAMSFNGSSYMNITSPLLTSALDSSFTISLWINPQAQGLIFGNKGVGGSKIICIGCWSAGSISIADENNKIIGSEPFTQYNQSSLFVWSYNQSSGISKVYQNGNLTGTFSYSLTNYSGSTYLGNPSAYQYYGTMDEVSVWNRTLSDSDVFNIYKRGILHLNLSVKSCNSADCSDAAWQNLGEPSSQTFNLASGNISRYFQYKTYISTDNLAYTPELFNVSINYALSPSVSLISPVNNYNISALSFISNSNINESNLVNISWNFNGTSTVLESPNQLINGDILMLNFDNNSAYGENATNAYDFSGNGNNATCSGASCPVFNSSGKYGGAMTFNGVNNYLSIQNNNEFNLSNITLSAWIKTNSTSEQYILNKYSDSFYFATGFNGDGGGPGSLCLYLSSVSGSWLCSSPVTNVVNDSKWHFVAATYNQSIMAIYIDGVMVNSRAASAVLSSGTSNLLVGSRSANMGFFNGTIDEVGIWNRSLSSAELNEIYLSQLHNYPGVGSSLNYTGSNLSVYMYPNISQSTIWNVSINQSKPSNGVKYTYSLSATNAYGITNTSETRLIVLDTFGPNVTSISPNSSYLSNSTQNFTVNISDSLGTGIGISNATLNLNYSNGTVSQDSLSFASGVTNTVVGIVKTITDGVYSWWWRVVDNLGNIVLSSSMNASVDSTAPVVYFNNPTPSNESSIPGNLLVNATVNEVHLQNLSWILNGSTITYGSNYILDTPNQLFSGTIAKIDFDNLSAYGENATNAYDFSGNGNNATCSGASCPVFNSSGKYGGAVVFNGTENMTIKDSNSFHVNNTITISAWIKPSSLNPYGMIVSKNDSSWGLRFNSNSGRIMFVARIGSTFVDQSYYSTSSVLQTNNWYHVVGVYNGTNVITYVNGAIDGNYYIVGPIGTSTDDIYIGSRFDGYGFNGSIDELQIWNRSLSASEVNQLYNSELINLPDKNDTHLDFSNSVRNVSMQISYNGSLWNALINQSNLIKGIDYTWQILALDFGGLSNPLAVYTIKGNSPPAIQSVSQTPNIGDYNSIDPGVNVNVSVNVSDIDGNFDSAVLQWKNSTYNGWNNISMQNVTTNGIYNNILDAILTLPSYEDNITYRIIANDTLGATNISDNYTLQSYWDCTWTVSPDLGQFTGSFNENKFITNFSINNTGDPEYNKSNCTLQFRTTYSLTEGRMYMDGSYFKPSNTYTVQAGHNQSISINATFLGAVAEEPAYFSTTELLGISNTSSENTSFTLVTTAGGPYLYEQITSAPTSEYLTYTNFTLSGYLRNLAGDGSVANTAYNVSFYWSLPSDFLVSGGTTSYSFDNISNSSAIMTSINVTFNSTNLASLPADISSVNLYASGVNASGSKILVSGNRSLVSEQANISLICYNVSDGIYVTSCGSLDGDYSAPVSIVTAPSSGGGGGGGGTAAVVSSKAEYQFTRGREDNIGIPLFNPDSNDSLSSIQVDVSGDISKYIQVSPFYGSIGPRQNGTIILKVLSPSYIPLGLQSVTLHITGKIGSEAYIEDKVVNIEVNDISSSDASALLNESERLYAMFISSNFSSQDIASALADERSALKSLDYVTLQDKASLIRDTVNSAIDAKNTYDELISLTDFASSKGIDVSGTQRLLKLTALALERNDFSEALARVNDAKNSYALETKGEFGSVSYIIRNNPSQISFAALFLLLFSITLTKSTQILRVKQKINDLHEEERIINDLIKVVQKQAFKDKTISMEEYQAAIEHYEKRLADVIEDVISLETQRIHWLGLTGKSKRLKTERQRVVELIKEIQTDYLKKRNIETKSYELRLKSYNKKISEIDEAIANLEAQQALKKMRLSD